MKWLIIAAFFFLFATQSQAQTFCYVKDTGDGDGLVLETFQRKADGSMKELVRSRMSKYDAPERDQRFGKEATAALKKMCKGNYVYCDFNGLCRYGRPLSDVYIGSKHVNLEMVKIGMGHPYPKSPPEFNAAARNAIKKRIGLWQDKIVIHPQEWRDAKKQKRKPFGMARDKYIAKYS